MSALYWAALTLGEIDERRKEETGAIERKDRRANLPGFLLVRQIFSRWGGRERRGGGEVKRQRLGRTGEEVEEVLTHSEKQKCITVHVSRKMSWELTGRAEQRGGRRE